jgi:hypothetical protein
MVLRLARLLKANGGTKDEGEKEWKEIPGFDV